MTNSRAKGARGEREWRDVLRTFWPARQFERGVQSRGGGKEAADVFGLPGFHFEVKRVEALNLWSALAQAERDATPGDVPVVAFRRNRTPWFVALDARDFLALIQQWEVALIQQWEVAPGITGAIAKHE